MGRSPLAKSFGEHWKTDHQKVTAIFSGVSAGLVVIGLGLALCMLAPAWRGASRAARAG